MHLYALVKLVGSYSFSDTINGSQNASFDSFAQIQVKCIMSAGKTPQLDPAGPDLMMGKTANGICN